MFLCSAGVGRTGMFIALHTQIQAIKEKDYIDVVGYVQYMRRQRCLMVQTEVRFTSKHYSFLNIRYVKDVMNNV